VAVDIDVKHRIVCCGEEEFPFDLHPIEERLLAGGGVGKAYGRG